MYFVLKSCDVLDILVPILYHLNDSRNDPSKIGLIHIGVFILLLLSGERNFGVRLNKPFAARAMMDLPIFTGSHADLLIVVFHKLITAGHQRLQPLFDCLLTIIVNVSPYLKTLSMVSTTKLLHLLEAFSTPWFLYSNQTNHHLIFFLLEIFNNIIQYQFDGNSNLVYTIIRKRNIFHALANLPTDFGTIQRSLNKQLPKKSRPSMSSSKSCQSISSSKSDPLPNSADPLPASVPASPVEQEPPGDLQLLPPEQSMNVTLAATPRLDKMTEKTQPNPPSDDGAVASRRISRASSVSSGTSSKNSPWQPTSEWVASWKQKLPLQTIMRMLQVCII